MNFILFFEHFIQSQDWICHTITDMIVRIALAIRYACGYPNHIALFIYNWSSAVSSSNLGSDQK